MRLSVPIGLKLGHLRKRNEMGVKNFSSAVNMRVRSGLAKRKPRKSGKHAWAQAPHLIGKSWGGGGWGGEVERRGVLGRFLGTFLGGVLGRVRGGEEERKGGGGQRRGGEGRYAPNVFFPLFHQFSATWCATTLSVKLSRVHSSAPHFSRSPTSLTFPHASTGPARSVSSLCHNDTATQTHSTDKKRSDRLVTDQSEALSGLFKLVLWR